MKHLDACGPGELLAQMVARLERAEAAMACTVLAHLRPPWRRIADWLDDRSIVAGTASAAEFRKHMVVPFARDAAERFALGVGLSEAVDRAGVDWYAVLMAAVRDGLAAESWVAMQRRLVDALRELEGMGVGLQDRLEAIEAGASLSVS